MEPNNNMDKGLTSRISNLLLIVFVVAIALLSAIKLLFPAEDYREQITQHLTEHTGQPIEIVGSLEWYLSPFPSIFSSTVAAPETGISLQNVSISFSLLDLIGLKLVPSQIEIEHITSNSDIKSVPLIQQVIIGFDSSEVRPNTFEFMLDSHASSLNKEHHQLSSSAPNLKIQGEVLYPDSGRYHIEGRLSNTGATKQNQLPIPQDTNLQLDITESDNPHTHLFDLNLSAGEFSLFTNGILKVTKQNVSIILDKLETPNMSLSGQSDWQRNNALVHTTLQSKHINVPAACFEKSRLSSSTQCYDLAMLMMLPGKNSLQANTLSAHKQSLKDINLDWAVADGEIIIQQAHAKAVGGTVNAEGRFTLATNAWSFDLQGENIMVEALLQAAGHKPQLHGTATINIQGSGQFKGLQLLHHKIDGKVDIANGKTSLFNLEKELCSQVKGVVVTDVTSTPFKRLNITIDEENFHLKIPYFSSELDGATINGQGEVTQDQTVDLVMNVKLDKEEWELCKLPRALTGIEWPLTCNKPVSTNGDCSINFKQMGLSALLLADDPDLKDKTKQQVQALKKSDKVKKVLSRFEKWLEE